LKVLPRILLFLVAVSCFDATRTLHGGVPVVAIHDSELTRALDGMTVANPTTPSGAGTTGFEWWPTNWHYFVMPESLKEALKSDGTAYEVVSDGDISSGRLLDTNGQPRYPILISLASEAVRDDEIGALTNYVAAGGTLLVGSSAFTRQTNGLGRGDFAFANEMGLHMGTTNLTVGRDGMLGNDALQWRAAGSAFSPVSPLGSYELRLDGQGKAGLAALSTSQGPLQLDGSGSWTTGRNPEFQVTARVPPPYREQLSPLLRLISVQRDEGTFDLQLK